MSLLTEEQIKEIDMMRFRFNEYHFKNELEKWNEKQQPAQPLAQFEPDWDEAPNNATSAALDLSWWITEHGNWSNSKRIATYERPEPVITPHPHAKIMAKYAEVAARRVDPWVEFEMRIGSDCEWVKSDISITFSTYWEYRHIGETK